MKSSEEELKTVVNDLEEGVNYEFRIVPVNQAGKGTASEVSPKIFTKSRKGFNNEFHIISF